MSDVATDRVPQLARAGALLASAKVCYDCNPDITMTYHQGVVITTISHASSCPWFNSRKTP